MYWKKDLFLTDNETSTGCAVTAENIPSVQSVLSFAA